MTKTNVVRSEKSYAQMAELFKVMANPKRIKLVSMIVDKEMAVNKISSVLKVRKSNTSQHLKLLKLMGIVKSRRDGKNIYYKVVSPKIEKLLQLFP